MIFIDLRLAQDLRETLANEFPVGRLRVRAHRVQVWFAKKVNLHGRCVRTACGRPTQNTGAHESGRLGEAVGRVIVTGGFEQLDVPPSDDRFQEITLTTS